MKRLAVSTVFLMLLSPALNAQTNSLLIEDMTWTEVHDAIAAQLGNALVYPTMPFAPTGDWGLTEPGIIDPAKKTGHMRFAGSVNLSADTFGAVAHDVALSAISAGFKNVLLMCDHGGAAQSQLKKVAEKLNDQFSPKGIHVYYIPDLYFKEKEVMREYMQKHGLPIDLHAGTDDTSELEYVDKMVNGEASKWIRAGKLVNAHEGDGTGVDGDQTKATLELGKMFTDAKVSLAVKQIKQMIAAGK
jgi:creatinine amidohydrolase/Fe(II)-dependent formamide hydrolase-like protein